MDQPEWLADGVTRTFRYPTGMRILFFLGMCFFAFLSVLAANSQDAMVVPLCFGPLALLCLVLLACTGYSIEVSWDEISWHWLGREKRMSWADIGRIRNRDLWGTLEISHRNGSCSFKLDSQVEGYLLIVHLLSVKRPDLWNATPPASDTFRKVFWPQLLFGGGGTFMGVMGVKGLFEGDVLAGIVLLAFGGLVFAVLLLQVQAVTFEGDELVVKDAFRRQRLKASSIKELRMETTRAGNAMVHPVVVELKNGKKISLVGFRVGSPKLFHALVAWLEKNLA